MISMYFYIPQSIFFFVVWLFQEKVPAAPEGGRRRPAGPTTRRWSSVKSAACLPSWTGSGIIPPHWFLQSGNQPLEVGCLMKLKLFSLWGFDCCQQACFFWGGGRVDSVHSFCMHWVNNCQNCFSSWMTPGFRGYLSRRWTGNSAPWFILRHKHCIQSDIDCQLWLSGFSYIKLLL